MAVLSFENHTPIIANSAFVDTKALIIGEVVLEEEVSVWPFAVIRGDINSIHIGARTNIQDGSILHVTSKNEFNMSDAAILIGQSVTIGHGVMLHGCIIQDDCLIGIGATILDKAVIEHHVIIGANSLVPPRKVLKSGYLYVGNPAQPIRPLNEQDLKLIKYNADEYVILKNRYLKSLQK